MTSPIPLADALAHAATQIGSRRPLPDVLQDLVDMAQRSLPGVDHVGISIAHADGRVQTVAATDDFVRVIDNLQYELDEGPCLSAMREQGTVVINNLPQERRWPRFTQQAAARGLRAQMGVRLFADGRTVGGLNLYSTVVDEIDPDTVHIARVFASHAALALGVARLEEDFVAGMISRQRVGVAVGILMQKYELDEDGAFEYLARVSQTSGSRLRDIADELVQSASERNRRVPPEPPG